MSCRGGVVSTRVVSARVVSARVVSARVVNARVVGEELSGHVMSGKSLQGSNEWCPELDPKLQDLLGQSTLRRNKREHSITQSLFHSVQL